MSRFFRYDAESNSVIEVSRENIKQIPRYPIALESMAVHPSQIAEATQYDSQHGVRTEYTPDGRPVVRDPGHYKRYRRLHGFHFKNGYES